MMIVNCWIALNEIKPVGSRLTCEVEYNQGELITDLMVNYRSQFRKEHKMFWIEVENEPNGDIEEKIEKYEALKWSRSIENLEAGCLYVVCKKQSTLRKLEAVNNAQGFFAIPYQGFSENWKW